ncbi:hypothetical protein D1872_222380 [compost metagenome]
MQTSEKIHPDQLESESISIYRDIGPYKGYEYGEKYVTVSCEHANLTLKLVTPDIVRVSCSLDGENAQLEPSKALLPYDPLEGWNVIEWEN